MDGVPLSNPLARWGQSAFGRALRVLNKSDQKKLSIVIVIQIFMGALDLLGVVAIGLLGALSVTEIQGNQPGIRVSNALSFLNVSNSSYQRQALILSAGAVTLLVGRTILSIFFTRRILFFLSRRGTKISAELIARVLSQSLLALQARTTQETLYAVTRGVQLIVIEVIATLVVLIADFSLLIIMGIGLFVVDPTTALGTFAVFSLVAFFLYRFMHVQAGELGIKNSELNILSNEKIVEVFGSYRESVVRNRRDYYSREIGQMRYSLADTTAKMSFLPFVSKYVLETTVVLGALLIGATQFILQDAVHAVATLTIFLAAGTRIAPAVLRIQQGSVMIQGSLGAAMPTLDLIDELGNTKLIENVDDSVDITHEGFEPTIRVENVSLAYPGKSTMAISNISLTVPSGASVAFVGPSGAGKTTIIDVLLGVLNPDKGEVLISNLPPLQAVAKWPGAISYVPQDVVIAAGTVRENVSLGYPIDVATDDLVMSALKVAHLEDYVAGLPQGVDTEVGERGAMISGGQRQRLGIARAMFTRPLLLVLDEATSSLDGETEASISDAIHALRGSTTVIIIAHRLSTVRNVDIVVYLSNGEVLATGTFDEVRKAVPDFDRQALLMGL